ncbi:cilia- and flagella-associated protein 97 isoform X2 [Amia ocellicauda]|uniref:cilia- and flagella-associated protein 97 isoform X2 n=1 Tax=Amia ocellicauda TaxID=2972642 RepID=UPI0034641675
MYSPKDLEGEVDHAFFDSDFEDGGQDRGGVSGNIHEEKPLEARGKSNGGSAQSRESSLEEEREKGSSSLKEDLSRPSSASSSLSYGARSEVSSSGKLEGASGRHLIIPHRIPTGSSTEEREYEDDDEEADEEDSYNRSEDESEAEREEKHARCRSAHPGSSVKKACTKFRTHSPPSPSESESSSSDAGSCVPELSPQRKPMGLLSVSSPRHRPRYGLAARKQRLRLPDESEDTVTDVSPLSTPDISPIQSFDLALVKDSLKKRAMRKQENVSVDLSREAPDWCPDQEGEKSPPKTGKTRSEMCHMSYTSSESVESEIGGRHGQKVLNDALDLNQLLKAFMSLEKKTQESLVIDSPGGKARKNFSFSNEEVRCIDRENQRLLRELSRQAPKPRIKSATARKPTGSPVKLYHTALNRQREQQRIERENMAFLKRLESVKPTVGMKRSEQLADYQRQAQFNGSAAPSRLDRLSASRGGSTGKPSRPCSASSLRNARAAVVSSTAVPKPRVTEPRTAWS